MKHVLTVHLTLILFVLGRMDVRHVALLLALCIRAGYEVIQRRVAHDCSISINTSALKQLVDLTDS
jgi:hypothetical protein